MSKPEVSEGNECGIVINSVSTEQHGMWTCRVFITGNSLEGSKNVIVTGKYSNDRLRIVKMTSVLYQFRNVYGILLDVKYCTY